MFCDCAGSTVSSTATLCDSEAPGILGLTVAAGSTRIKEKHNVKIRLAKRKRKRKENLRSDDDHLSKMSDWRDCSTDHMMRISQPDQSQTLG